MKNLSSFHHFHNFIEAFGNHSVIISLMRNETAAAILDPITDILKVPPALPAQSIKRAKAKKAVEISGIIGRVTGKSLASGVGKKRICLAAPGFLAF
jgi:hypothetical protein